MSRTSDSEKVSVVVDQENSASTMVASAFSMDQYQHSNVTASGAASEIEKRRTSRRLSEKIAPVELPAGSPVLSDDSQQKQKSSQGRISARSPRGKSRRNSLPTLLKQKSVSLAKSICNDESILSSVVQEKQGSCKEEISARKTPSKARRNSLPSLLRQRSLLLSKSFSSDDSNRISLDAVTDSNIKSCMSVKKLEDSLQSAASGERRRRRESLPNLSSSHWSDDEEEKIQRKPVRRVSFHEVEVRNYNVTLGDNPSVQKGPPLSLDWNYDPNHTIRPLEDYEVNRSQRRRGSTELKLPLQEREERLKTEGVSSHEMSRAAMDVRAVRNQRIKTEQTLHHQQVHEVLENAKRRLKRVVTLTTSKKEQRRLWKDAQKWAREENRSTKDDLPSNKGRIDRKFSCS